MTTEPKGLTDAEKLAREFHDRYERYAPSFGYETRKETQEFDPTTANGRLMIAVCANLIDSGLAGAASVPREPWYPEQCPITGLPFFMTIEHPDLGEVPTYGGPYDSYTIPESDTPPPCEFHEREYFRHRYDHDLGGWVEDEGISMRVIHEERLIDLLYPDDAARECATTPVSTCTPARKPALPPFARKPRD